MNANGTASDRLTWRPDTLGRLPEADAGDVVECPHCRVAHVLHGRRTLFVVCADGETRIAGVAGRLVLGTPADGDAP